MVEIEGKYYHPNYAVGEFQLMLRIPWEDVKDISQVQVRKRVPELSERHVIST